MDKPRALRAPTRVLLLAALAACLGPMTTGALAQTAARSRPAASVPGAAPAKVSKTSGAKQAKDAKSVPAYPAVPADAGYRFGPTPAWVKPLPPAEAGAGGGAPAGAKALREPLADVQIQVAPQSRTASYVHLQRVALDASVLREVSEPQIGFNPAYQQLVIHQVAVLREGRREDRLKGARIEMMRREQGLERQMIDGVRTALVVISDVRVGDVVEVAYTLEGENPIFEGRFATLLHLADDAPMDRLHLRVEAPLDRPLQVRGIATDFVPERFEEGGRQVLRVQRSQVPAVVDEAGTPPWFKVFPALQVSDYADWAELDRWAQRLFAPEPGSAEKLAAQLTELLPEFKDATPEARVAAVLRFVQDEVRYFSASLGESSHRPKPAARTLAERLGDCKDKVLLFNTLLAGLGVQAQPTLVSSFRNRGVRNYLPGHDLFDHVISRVQIGEAVYYLDPTLTGQGLSLEKRGYFPYGAGLVVGAGAQGPVAIAPPGFAQDALSFFQDWDLSDLKRPAQLHTRFRASGLAAERWRAVLAQAGADKLAEAIGGNYVKSVPGLVSVGAAEIKDDRASNEFELGLRFEHPAPGRYQRGVLELELPTLELGEVLVVPAEARRRYPYWLDLPRRVDLRIAVKGPRPFAATPPAPQQLGDKHFSFSSRVEAEGGAMVSVVRYERRGDEVLPGDLEGYRERVARAHQLVNNRARLALLDFRAPGLEPEFTAIDRRLAAYRGSKPDELYQILQANEITRLIGRQLLPQIQPGSRLAARVLAERAQASNLLGDFDGGLADAEQALKIQQPPEDAAAALEARGVALIGLGRPAQALAAFSEQAALDSSNPPGSWLGTAHYLLGDYARAEAAARDSAAQASGEPRQFALLWVYLAAERQGGRGRAAIADELAGLDASTDSWGASLLRYLGGALDRDGLLKLAKAQPAQERLRLAEAYFFIGQQLAAQGRAGEARPWFERTLSTQALPYREFTLAQWELKQR
ncbi:MAG: hypothetical protein DI603_21895 [Roseateles depolymerans]|uniref:DUF3857 domain-containing protein n=1 Tax=Roseateles depolymerans TaxID=76731 RepID=A0A2W5DA44_9BURK|nr:MAG: hypothetical protein DI603_21895 [Roseateles depolymerans]